MTVSVAYPIEFVRNYSRALNPFCCLSAACANFTRRPIVPALTS